MLKSSSSDYLANVYPESEPEFVKLLEQITLFNGTPTELLHQLFQYSKFVFLKDRQRSIWQGTASSQEVFMLIEGSIQVLIEDDSGTEELIETISDPFTIFGERSMLQEERGASIKADGNTLLLSINLSSLPDIFEGLDEPEKRHGDNVYLNHVSMYTVLAIVLTQRLDRLVRYQYKLRQSAERVQESQILWKQDLLLCAVFEQFCSNKLPAFPELRSVLKKKLQKYDILNPYLSHILSFDIIKTRGIYLEFVRLDTLDDIPSMDEILFDIIQEIAGHVQGLPEYTTILKSEVYNVPAMTTLSDYLGSLYELISQSNMLSENLSKPLFLEAILREDSINPSLFSAYLSKTELVKDNYSLAYIMFLMCQSCIYAVSEANQKIRQYVRFLNTYNLPKLDSFENEQKNFTLVDGLKKIYQDQKSKANGAS